MIYRRTDESRNGATKRRTALPGRQTIEVALVHRKCRKQLQLFGRYLTGVDLSTWTVSQQQQLPAVEDGMILLTCRRCGALPEYPSSKIEQLLDDLASEARHAHRKILID